MMAGLMVLENGTYGQEQANELFDIFKQFEKLYLGAPVNGVNEMYPLMQSEAHLLKEDVSAALKEYTYKRLLRHLITATIQLNRRLGIADE